MLGTLVYTIIEAPDHGWTATRTLLGFGVAVAAAVVFVWWERRHDDPLIDVSLFANLRFSAASGAVTVAFFALFGFIFLITQFFQQLQGSARSTPAFASCRSRCRSRSGPCWAPGWR